MQTYAQLMATVEDQTDALGTSVFTDAVLTTMLTDAFIEAFAMIANYIPHIVVVPFTIESRTGTATATSANNLVDTSESQFVSGDVGKVVYNTTDKTWAVITTFTSSSQVALSKDIMVSGENYEIYNKDCTNKYQINVSDVIDHLWIQKAQYKGKDCNIQVNESNPNIIELINVAVDDSKQLSSGTQPYTEVMVYFAKRHKVSQLTDLAGAVDLVAGYSAGDTSMVVDALQATGTVEEGQEFTIANTRGTYTVTADATIAANEATISFFPGLQSDVANDVVVTFKQSTLNPVLDPLVVEFVVGRIIQRFAMGYINSVPVGAGDVWQKYLQDGQSREAKVIGRLNRLARKSSTYYSR